MSGLRREGECVSCGECCRTLRITGILTNIVAQHGSLESARAYYSYRGIKITDVSRELNAVGLEMNIPCDKLTKDNRCALHPDSKPLICDRYPQFPDDIETCGYSFK
ncbi:MAG TPA: hypothetical protein ENI77_00570 [Nitrospirae bacterium]|nr:hypothetical protein [Nitrospirota bacterium]